MKFSVYMTHGIDHAQTVQSMRTPRMADLRNIYAPDEVTAAGFEAYTAVGR